MFNEFREQARLGRHRRTERLFTSTRTGDVDATSGGAGGGDDLGMQELEIGPEFELADGDDGDGEPWAFGEIVRALRSRFGAVPLALYSGDEFRRLPARGTQVERGDYLLVALARRCESDLRDFLDAEGPAGRI